MNLLIRNKEAEWAGKGVCVCVHKCLYEQLNTSRMSVYVIVRNMFVFVQLQYYLGTILSVLTFIAGLSKRPVSKNYTLD